MKTQEQRDAFAAYMRARNAKIKAGEWTVKKRAGGDKTAQDIPAHSEEKIVDPDAPVEPLRVALP